MRPGCGPACLRRPARRRKSSQLNAAVNEALASDDLKALLAKQGAEPTGGTEQSFADTIQRDLSIWTDLVKKTGIKIE